MRFSIRSQLTFLNTIMKEKDRDPLSPPKAQPNPYVPLHLAADILRHLPTKDLAQIISLVSKDFCQEARRIISERPTLVIYPYNSDIPDNTATEHFCCFDNIKKKEMHVSKKETFNPVSIHH